MQFYYLMLLVLGRITSKLRFLLVSNLPLFSAVPYYLWLDLLPIAEMRDNLIFSKDLYDETRLCLDI